MRKPKIYIRIILPLVLLLVFVLLAKFRQPELPVYGQLANFSFTNHLNQASDLQTFSNKPMLLNFFFTSCKGICPNIMGKIARVHKDFSGRINIISLSVDPKRDNVEVLSAYLNKLKTTDDFDGWILGRAELVELNEFIEKVARLPSNPDPQKHTVRVLLIDEKMQVRAYLDGLASDFYEKASDAIESLL